MSWCFILVTTCLTCIAANPHVLTEWSDPAGRLQLKAEYDSQGRVISGVHTEDYADMVIQRLRDAEIRGGRNAILIELDDLRRELQSGILNLNSRGVNK